MDATIMDMHNKSNLERIASATEKIAELLEPKKSEELVIITALRHYYSSLMFELKKADKNDNNQAQIKSIIGFAREVEKKYGECVSGTEYEAMPIYLKMTPTIEKYLSGIFD
ncbi:hypothetical protein LCGC14_0195930 [marine sediment metagenome]|uniref:Uncharacterized protein n=1 Tax=marine sediment metagenome TaxID=412755 RepID=A0A0F9UKK8_9ZZZZ